MELMQANRQWSSRPADERFLSLTDIHTAALARKHHSAQRVLSSRAITAAPVADDSKALALVGPGGSPVTATHWAFGQVCERAKVPAEYARRIPAALAADCINHGLATRDIEDVQVMLTRDPAGTQLKAMNGPNYGRVWDADFVGNLIKRFGDGRTGQFTVPGEFKQAVPITKQNTTLYASDRDVWVFLADEHNRIEIPNRRGGKHGSLARGFFAWNSEVGSQTMGIATFLFDYVCSNRIVWGATEYKEVRIRHTSSAPDKLIYEVAPALERYAESSTATITRALTDARNAHVDDVNALLLKNKFTKSQIEGITAAHMADENRPMESLWDVATGVTAYARNIAHQDARVVLERKAGDILDLVA